MRRIQRCWWTFSTVWLTPTPAPLSCGAPGWRAWRRFTSATEISQRLQILHVSECLQIRNIAFWRRYDFMFDGLYVSDFPSGCHVLHPHLSPDCWIAEEERSVLTRCCFGYFLQHGFSVFVPMRKYLCISGALIFLLWCVHHCKHGNLQPEHPFTAFVYLSANLSFSHGHFNFQFLMSSGGWGVMCVREKEHIRVCFCVWCVLVWGRFFENSQRSFFASKSFFKFMTFGWSRVSSPYTSLYFTFICSPVCFFVYMLLHLDSSMCSNCPTSFCIHFMHAACLPIASTACHQLGLFVNLVLEHKAKASGSLLCEPPHPPPLLPNRLLESWQGQDVQCVPWGKPCL